MTPDAANQPPAPRHEAPASRHATPARTAASPWRSRARIGAAAAASVLLHLGLARGLALTTVGSAPRPPAGTESAKPITRRETADYSLRAPRTRPDVQPAHERPLSMAPLAPAAPSPRPASEASAAVASWQPREAALLERLTGGAESIQMPSRPPAAPARTAVAAAGTTLATPPDASDLPAMVTAPGRPRPAARGAAPSPAPVVAADRLTPPPDRGESLLEGMASAARRPRGRRPADPPPAAARASVASAALGAAARASTSDAVVPGPPDAVVVAPAVGPAPARRTLTSPMPEPVGSTRPTADAEETLSVADVVGMSLPGADAPRGGQPRVGGISGPPKLERIAAVTLPAESRARDVSEAFARRSRSARDEPREGAADGSRAATQGRADRMIDAGLAYLARTQRPDGRWTLAGGGPAAEAPRLNCDTAATGLALLSFFGAGHDHFAGPHRDTIRRGIEFLLATQKADGDLYEQADPLSNSCAWLYSHAIASMALCEAVGMTGDPLVKPSAERACRFIAASRHPERGGWRYVPGTDADLSVSGWMLVALRSGQLAGLDVDPAALAGAATLLEAAATTRPDRYAYNPRAPDQRPAPASAACMTAVGTLMRLHTGWAPSDPRVASAARDLEAARPSYAQRLRDCYLWYYASQVLVHTGGTAADAWYRDLVDVLEPRQQRDGPLAGSWDPLGAVPDRWGAYGGRLYVTALHLLALEVPDRHLPTLSTPE